MDEPLTFLDPKLRTQMRVELKTLQRRLGVTTIYVTHDQAEAMTMSDRITVLENGIKQQVGTPEEIYDKPENTFVAGFLGSPSINLFDCSYSDNNGTSILDTGMFKIDVSVMRNIIEKKKSGNELILGVRPEDTTISNKKSSETVESEVYLTEPLGSEIILIMKLGDNLVNAKAEAKTSIRPGDKVNLGFNKDKIHIFNKSGENIL
jgi:multiple sugar transport system ATP-binding protein